MTVHSLNSLSVNDEETSFQQSLYDLKHIDMMTHGLREPLEMLNLTESQS